MAGPSFDLEDLVSVEQTFFDDGYTDGFAHGRIHGLIEGRALGREKGFEMWEELGFYEGFARTWGAVLSAQGEEERGRSANHVKHLLDLISSFPRLNPSTMGPQHDDTPEVDIPKLFRQIRSRYKALCASLGVRPSLRALEEDTSNGSVADESNTVEGRSSKSSGTRIWRIEGDRTKPQDDGLSF